MLSSMPRGRHDHCLCLGCVQISGLEDLLNSGHGLVTEAAQPAAGIPHASEAYIRILENARKGQFPISPSNSDPLTSLLPA